jgi:hypothetical protein
MGYVGNSFFKPELFDALVYKTGGYTVAVNKYGSFVYSVLSASNTDDLAINAALTAATGGLCRIAKGTYNCSNDVVVPATTILEGEGETATILNYTAYKKVSSTSVSNTIVRNLRLTGKGTVYHRNGSNLKVSNVTVTGDDSVVGAAFNAVCSGAETIDGLRYESCTAQDGACFGFQIYGPGGETLKNIQYHGCRAINCGKDARVNDYVIGFNIQAGVCEDILYHNCIATGCWESGFHQEAGATKTRVKYVACSAYGNGTKPTPTYGSGFLCQGDTTVIGCTSSLNGKYGYYVTSPAIAVACQSSANVTDAFVSTGSFIDCYDAGKLRIARGRTSIADGGTISHGLASTPTWALVSAITSGEFASVTAMGATTITVAIKKHDNSAGTTQFINWECGY